MRNPFVSILPTLLAASITGCIDANPSTFPVDAAPDVPAMDVDLGDVEGDADPQGACRACFQAPEDPGPGCATAYAACLADPRCATVYECGFERVCWAAPTQQDLNNCGLPCLLAVGVNNPADPVILLTQPLATCALTVCHPACGATP